MVKYGYLRPRAMKKTVKMAKHFFSPQKVGRFFLFRRIVKYLGIATGVLVVLYVTVGISLGNGFLKNDLQKKYGRVAGATTLIMQILGPPNKPILSVFPLCQNNSPYLALSWTSDDQMDYFDIERDGSPLVSGIVENIYHDEAVLTSETHSYKVTAFNSLGQTASDEASGTVLGCELPPKPIDPTCVITRFHKTNLFDFSGELSTKERQPTFYGTTNMPHAKIEIIVLGKTDMIVETQANENGYWEWRPEIRFNYGDHTFWVTAVDPENGLRNKTASLKFGISRDEAGGENKKEEKKKKENLPSGATVPGASLPVPGISWPNLSVEVKNWGNIAYTGKTLSLETKMKNFDEKFIKAKLTYLLIDEDGKIALETYDDVSFFEGIPIKKTLSIPSAFKAGKYKILVETTYKGAFLSADNSFLLEEIPLFNLGGGVVITVGQVMDNLLWVILWLLLLLIIFLILLGNEYRTSRYAIIQVTEEMFRDKKFIS